VWHFGDEAYAAISRIMHLRESIRGYVQSHLDVASREGAPLLRPMTFDFTDVDCVDAVDQYMFGPTYLVAPVLSYKANSRIVYLPDLLNGERWEYYYDPSLQFTAGEWHQVSTTRLDTFPLFLRSAAVTSLHV